MRSKELVVTRHSQIESFRASGQTAEEWCKENGITVSTLKYWITKTNRENKQAKQGFIAFSPATCKPSTLVVKIGSYIIEVGPGFDPTTFRETVLLLKNL